MDKDSVDLRFQMDSLDLAQLRLNFNPDSGRITATGTALLCVRINSSARIYRRNTKYDDF